jgi:hypothetical protein
MRLWPDEVFLMALQGWKSLHGRPFISKEEALENLKRLTGQDLAMTTSGGPSGSGGIATACMGQVSKRKRHDPS